MSELFLKVVNMSISAGWLIAAVLAFRIIFQKAPKQIRMLLWAIVAVRLLCPVSLESVLSLIPSAETVSPEIMISPQPEISSGVPVIDNTVNPVISHSFAPEPTDSANPLQIWIPILSGIWIAGIVVLLAYAVISYWRLRRRVSTAVRLQDNIYQSENTAFPFVMGVLWPKVYLPFKLNKQDMDYVIAHERAHIKRRDYWWKPLGFLLMTVYWFNPLMWLAYILFCRDIELACDEKVVNAMEDSDKAAYAQALLNCSIPHRMNLSCPLAFGEVGVKQRVKSVLNYKKPAFWIMCSAVVILIVVAVCFLTDPESNKEILIEDPYFQLIDLGNYEYYYAIYNKDGRTVLEENVSDRCPSIYYLDDNTIVVSKSAGTGVYFCTYYDVIRDRLSKTYESPCAAAYGRVAYTDYRDKVILIVEDLFAEDGYYQEFDLNMEWKVPPVSDAEFLDQNTLSVTYLSIISGGETTTILNLQEGSGATESLISDAADGTGEGEAADFENSYFAYRYDEELEGIVITGRYRGEASVVIPDTIDGSSVIAIGGGAFSGSDSLTSITIPDSVTSIGSYAFSDCSNLVSITIPDSVTSMGNGVFWGCTSLADVTLSQNIGSINSSTFYHCTSLTNITIPDSVMEIREYTFKDCENLTSIIIPDSVTFIGCQTFFNCSSLTDLTLSDRVTAIRYNAFYGCDNLTVAYRGREYDSSDFEELYDLFDDITVPTVNVSDEAEQTARAAYLAFISGDVSQVDREHLRQSWVDYYLYYGELEYAFMDVDGDGVSELLIQLVDDPVGMNAVFHYSDGLLYDWEFDTVDMSEWSYPLQNGIMVYQYRHSGTCTWIGLHYRPNGITEALFTFYSNGSSSDPYYEIDGVEVDQATFEAELEERITDQMLERSAWTAIP